MGRNRRLLSRIAAVCAAFAAPAARAQIAPGEESRSGPTPPAQPTSAPASQAAGELPAALLTQLDALEDFAHRFDAPAYYALLDFVKRSPFAPGYAQTPIMVADWTQFAEHPRDFRGLPVTIEGTVGRNKRYVHQRHRELGEVWQLELSSGRQPVTCTVVLTENAADVGLGSRVRVTGYFVMMRRYRSEANREQQAALIVAAGPTLVARPPAVRADAALDWRWVLAPIVLGLLAAWWMLRRSAGRRVRDVRGLRARQPAPLDLSGDFAAWADADAPPDAGDQNAGPR
jgi:hypothetical protein